MFILVYLIESLSVDSTFIVIDDQSYGTVFLNFISEFHANQAFSLINYVLENPNVDIDLVVLPDEVPPTIYFNSRAGGSTGSYIVNYTGSTYSVPYNTEDDGLTYSTTISLSNWGTSSVLYKDKLQDLLIDYIDDDRDGNMAIMDSELLIMGTQGMVNSISIVGTYSLTFNFTDLAHNNLSGVNVNLDIII